MIRAKTEDAEMRYDVFISYSHGADSRTAAQLQRALQSIAKPWHRLRGMRVFRDQTDLSVAPEGWPVIQSALAESRFLLLMASKRAAGSKWVAKELAYWRENRSTETLPIALTDGDIVWDDIRGDFNWERTTSLPKQLSGASRSEPFWADLRWTSEQQILTLRNPEFLSSVAKLAAPVRNLDVAEIVSEDHRQHRRTLRAAYATGVALITILGIAFWQFQSRLAAIDRGRAVGVKVEKAGAPAKAALITAQVPDGASRVSGMRARTSARPTAPTPAKKRNAATVPDASAT